MAADDTHSAAKSASGHGEPRSLANKAWSGALWLSGSSLVTRLANIAVTAVVARIVAPEQFGVFAIAVIVLNVISGFAELGLASAISRRDQDLQSIAGTVTTISIASATTLAAGLEIFAVQIGTFLGSASAAPSIRILALAVFFTGVFAVPGAQLQRDFRQGAAFRANISGFVVGNIVLLALAFATGGAVAFAWSRVLGQIVTGGFMVASAKKVFLPGWSRAAVPSLLTFGIPLAAANTLSQLIVNVDNAFVGHMLGVTELGLYSIAFNVASWAGATLTTVLNGMVLPAISAVRAEGGDLRRVVGQSAQAVALVAAPIAAATGFLARPLVETIYGSRWVDAAPVLSLLAAFGFLSVLGLLFANVIVATGKTVRLLFVQVAAVAALIPALYFGLTLFGLVGVGYAHLIVICFVTLPSYLVSLRSATTAGPLLITRWVAWPIAAAGLGGALAWLCGTRIENPLVHLLVGGLVEAIVYLAFTAPIARRLVKAVRPRQPASAAESLCVVQETA